MSTVLPKIRQGTDALPTTSHREEAPLRPCLRDHVPHPPPGAVQERLGPWWVLYPPQGLHPLFPAEKGLVGVNELQRASRVTGTRSLFKMPMRTLLIKTNSAKLNKSNN